MHESGFKEAMPTDKLTKADLMAAMRVIAKERAELAERSERRSRVLGEISRAVDGMDEIGPLPDTLHDIVIEKMKELCREGLRHKKPEGK